MAKQGRKKGVTSKETKSKQIQSRVLFSKKAKFKRVADKKGMSESTLLEQLVDRELVNYDDDGNDLRSSETDVECLMEEPQEALGDIEVPPQSDPCSPPQEKPENIEEFEIKLDVPEERLETMEEAKREEPWHWDKKSHEEERLSDLLVKIVIGMTIAAGAVKFLFMLRAICQ